MTLALIAVFFCLPTLLLFGAIAAREFYRAAAYWITVGLNRVNRRRWNIDRYPPSTVSLICPICLHDRRNMITFHDFGMYSQHLATHRTGS